MKLLKFIMFNGLVKSYLNSDFWFLRWNKRVKSLTLEMWYTLSVFFPFIAIPLVLTMMFGDPLPTNFKWTELITLIPFGLMMVALINKDFVSGQSVVHRQLGYKVLDIKTMGPASKMQCMIRNLTGPISPIEIIFVLVNPKRRLGDIIAGTVLTDVPASDPQSILTEIKELKFDRQAKLTLLVSVVWEATSMFLFDPRVKLW